MASTKNDQNIELCLVCSKFDFVAFKISFLGAKSFLQHILLFLSVLSFPTSVPICSFQSFHPPLKLTRATPWHLSDFQ